MRHKFLIPVAVILYLYLLPLSAAAQATATPDPAANAPSGQTPEAPHPVPAHTGWGTLVKDTASDFVAYPKRKSTWVILGMGAVAALAVHPADDYVEEHIVGNEAATDFFKLGKWVGSSYVQIGSAVGLWVVGRYILPSANESRTNKVSHLGFDLLRAQIVSQALVQGMKYSFQRNRPTGECCAFPSGHAAAAFASAAVLERHMGYRASWPALIGATYVAASRLVDNRHFLSDVAFGAAVGTTAGWTVVGRHGRNEYALMPTPVRGGMAIMLTRVAD
jgi:membrane-associated phospholipid phosphatase